MLDCDRIVSQLNSPYTVTVAEEIPSTNTALKEMASPPMGTTLIAARQTGGRGRLGRQFHSPEGGLYLSVLIPPTDAVTCRAAVAWDDSSTPLRGDCICPPSYLPPTRSPAAPR